MAEERLQKILSHRGVASRRHAEEMIASGRVSVDGVVVTALLVQDDDENNYALHYYAEGSSVSPEQFERYLLETSGAAVPSRETIVFTRR